MKIFKKLLLVFLYPFVYIFHPKIRRANALRIKYWAMDRDFFKQERKKIVFIGLLSFSFWFGFIYLLPAMVYSVSSIAQQSMSNMSNAHSSAISQKTPELDKFKDPNVIVKSVVNPKSEAIVLSAKSEEVNKEPTFDDKIEAMKERAKKNNQ
jgi:hypothetical protein